MDRRTKAQRTRMTDKKETTTTTTTTTTFSQLVSLFIYFWISYRLSTNGNIRFSSWPPLESPSVLDSRSPHRFRMRSHVLLVSDLIDPHRSLLASLSIAPSRGFHQPSSAHVYTGRHRVDRHPLWAQQYTYCRQAKHAFSML